MSIRVRFAPSPTGSLHIGSARTALINYLFAKKYGGTYILRIEDTDQSRNVADATNQFLEGFKWLGLMWDEGPEVGGSFGPYSSMDRLSIYRNHLEYLLISKLAYPCFCSKEQLDLDREESKRQGKAYRYSGRCRNLTVEEQEHFKHNGVSYTIRFKVKESDEVSFTDLVRGQVEFQKKDIGDFIIIKSDGIPVYNFACTVDDSEMMITHVIRGEEHLSNTPLQILLYRAFGWEIPKFAHLPLILNPDGKKLSKRDESLIQFINQYRDLGYLPEALNNFLVLLGWAPLGEEEIFSMEDLEKIFTIERVGKSGAIFDPDKLTWMNEQYLKELSIEELLPMVKPYMDQAYGSVKQEELFPLVQLLQTGLKRLSDIVPLSKIFYEEIIYTSEGKELLAQPHVKEITSSLFIEIEQLETYDAENIKICIKNVQKKTGFKGKELFMPLRVVVTGQEHGPDLSQTMYLLGKEKVLARLNLA